MTVAPMRTDRLAEMRAATAAQAPNQRTEAFGPETPRLVFYRGAWCPYCNIVLSTDQQRLLPNLTRRGSDWSLSALRPPDGSLSIQYKHDWLTRCSQMQATPPLAGWAFDSAVQGGRSRATTVWPDLNHPHGRRHDCAGDVYRCDP
jgi:hypothetical protein